MPLVLEGEGQLAGERARPGDAFALPASAAPFEVQGSIRVLRCLQAGAHDVVLKLGPLGCFVAGAGFVEPVHVDAVDGTSAGDAFAAGLLCGLLHGWPVARAARLANAAGALATTAVGAAEGLRDLRQTLALAGLE